MKNSSFYLTFIGLTVSLLFLSCQQKSSSEEEVAQASYQEYRPQEASVFVTGNIPIGDSIQIRIVDPHDPDFGKTIQIPDGNMNVQIDELQHNQVYFLEVWLRRPGNDYFSFFDHEEILFVAQDGAQLTLLARPYSGLETLNKWRFTLEAEGDEQALLNAYRESVLAKWAEISGQVTVVMGASSGDVQGERMIDAQAVIAEEFVERKEPLISTMYFIFNRNDHRTRKDFYREIYDQASDEAKNSKYGIDLYNRLVRLDHARKQISLEDELIARKPTLLPFEASDFEDEKMLLVFFWSATNPASLDAAKEVLNLFNAEGQTDIVPLFFSLDRRMSQWQEATKTLGAPHSFMIRTEARQNLIDEFYIANLPRIMLIKPDGEIIESDLTRSDLPALFE